MSKDKWEKISEKFQKMNESMQKVGGSNGTGGMQSSLSRLGLQLSDERTKTLDEKTGEEPIDAFARINSYLYKYKPEAQAHYQGKYGIDDKEHFGPMAQELADNPITESTVQPNEDGFLTVDTKQLTMTNTAMIAQLSRKIQELEAKLGGKI